MDMASIVHVVIVVVAFASAAYLVLATALKADGALKPVGMVLAALLAVAGGLFVVGHAMGKLGHDSGPKPAAASDGAKAGHK